jgi:hypothetical protein
METGTRIIETLHNLDLRDRPAVEETLTALVDDLQHGLVVYAYVTGKTLLDAAAIIVAVFEDSTGFSWDEFQTMLATALEERMAE